MFYETVGEKGRGVFSQNNMYILTVDEKQHTFIEGMFTFWYTRDISISNQWNIILYDKDVRFTIHCVE